MNHRLSHISIHPASRIVGIIYGVGTAIFVPPAILAGFVLGDFPAWMLLMIVLGPVFYGVVAYLVTAVFCFLYNGLVEMTGGGVEITLTPVGEG